VPLVCHTICGMLVAMEKRPKNREFPASTNLYMRQSDLDWLHEHALHLTRSASRRVGVAEIVRDAIAQYRKLHETEINGSEQ
jgi:hypothetical protein